MKSSERPGRASAWLAAAVALLAFLAVAPLREPLLALYRAAPSRADSYVLPPAELARVMSLGYRAAAADLIFAHVLVDYGLHFQKKRRYEFVASYLDAVVTLDPTFREPYRLADTLITLQPEAPAVEDYAVARRLQERGLRQFPLDSELWLIAGQFSAYLAAQQVPEQERDAWKLDGAEKLARACELVSSNENIPYHCITAAQLYGEAGNRQAVHGFLERLLAVSEDEEIRRIASGYLGKVVGQAEREQVQARERAFRARWAGDLTFVTRDELLVIGPRFDAARCAGPPPRPAECVTSFRAWGEALESETSR